MSEYGYCPECDSDLIAGASKRIAELDAARISYANLFDGDVDSIHENIRKMKAEKKRLREAIQMHKESFDPIEDATEEDRQLWGVLQDSKS